MTARPPRPTGFTSRARPEHRRVPPVERSARATVWRRAHDFPGARCLPDDRRWRSHQRDVRGLECDVRTTHVRRPPQLAACCSESVSVPAAHDARRVCPGPDGIPETTRRHPPVHLHEGGHLPSAAGRGCGSAPPRVHPLRRETLQARDRAAVHERPPSRRARSPDRRRLRPA